MYMCIYIYIYIYIYEQYTLVRTHRLITLLALEVFEYIYVALNKS